uniref:Uncharacterized protein n=1 Tax=viral metagenome TaxID=1070528 RepID=A0A6C0HYD0_9ZZZZ
MHLPAQSGKTRKMTELMKRWDSIISLEGNTTHINIVFTSNSKLLTKQTMKRVVDATTVSTSDSDVSELSDGETEADNFNGIVNDTTQSNRTIAWISGGGVKMDERLIDLMIRAGDIDNVICCTNKQRMTRVISLIRLLHANIARLGGRTINIWIDEADACMRLWTKYLRTIIGFDTLINKIVLISATMSPVIRYFHKNGMECNLRVYDTTHAECYVRFSDCDVSHEYSIGNQSAIEQMCAVLDNVTVSAGSRWFCPGAIVRKSHDEIATELLRRGFNVLILNGDRKQLIFSDTTCPPVNVMSAVSDDVELSEAIRTLYYDYQLDSAPFAVTGNMCISRGITFASKNENFEFLFTHGIIPDIGSAEEIYQMVARCLGNFREFDSYIAPKLYMTERVASKIANQEHLAIELARRYYTGTENDTHTLSTDEFVAVANEHPVIAPPRVRKSKPQERVPVILSFGPENEYLYSLEKTMQVRRQKVKESVIQILKSEIDANHKMREKYMKLLVLIENPDTIINAKSPQEGEESYKRKITDVVKAARDGNPVSQDITKADKESGKNIVMMFVDKRDKRVGILVWSVDPAVY